VKNNLLLFLLMSHSIHAQCFIKKIDSALVIKWYTVPLISPQGCQLKTPDTTYNIKPYQTPMSKAYDNFISLSQSTSTLNDISGLTLLLETFKSAELSAHLGIQTQLNKSYAITTLTLLCQNKTVDDKIVLPSKPDSPIELSYTVIKSQILLQWRKASPHHIGHLVYFKNHDSLWCLTRSPLLDTAFYTKLVPQGNFAIKSIDVFGDTSQFSQWLPIPSHIHLQAPSRFKATQNNNTIHLNWSRAHYNKFHLVRWGALDTVELRDIPPDDTLYTDTPINHGAYTYALYGETAEGRFSDTVICRLPFKDYTPPDPPIRLGYKMDGATTTLTWQPSEANDLKGYMVYRVLLDSVGTKIKQFGVPLLQNAYTLHTTSKSRWCVTAIDHASNASSCSAVLTINHTTTEGPETPLISSLSKQGAYWFLSWLPASRASQYIIWQCKIDTVPTEAKVLAKIPASLHQWRINNTMLQGLYRYWLEAVDHHGVSSPPSNSVSQRFVILSKNEQTD